MRTGRPSVCLVYAMLLAGIMFSEVESYGSFDYIPGPIAGSSVSGNGFSGPWTLQHGTADKHTVQPSSLAYPGADSQIHYDSGSLQVNANERVGRFLDTSPNGPFAAHINSFGTIGKPGKTLYISFLMKSNYTSKFYAFELKRGGLGDAEAVLYVGNDVDGTSLQVCAFRNRDTSASNLGYQFQWLGEMSTDTELIVIRIDYGENSDNVTVYRNPSPDAEPEKSPDLVAPGHMHFDAVTFASFLAPADRMTQFDNIFIADTYADVMRFYSSPQRAQNPVPADGAVSVSDTDLVLRWEGGSVIPSAYEVYLSESLDAVLALAPEAYQGTTSDTTLMVNALNSDSTYYWSVSGFHEVYEPGTIWVFNTIKRLPVVISQPTSKHVFNGENASFTVKVSSDSTEHYQWYNADGALNDGGNVSGAQTRTLVISGATVDNEGGYYCEVTNASGTVYSPAADLVVIVKRIVGHWPLDADSTWTDLSGSENDLQLYPRAGHSEPNSFSYVTGVDGLADGAVEFDGTWSLGTMKADGTMNDIPVGDAPYSISLWFKTDNTNIDYLGLMGWGNYGTNFAANALAINNGLYGVRNYWWGRDLHAVGDTLLTDNNWHHLVATYDGDVRTIYLDGLAAASDNPGPHAVQTSENFRLGKTNTLNLNREWYRGVMDEVKVYNYAISDVDVAMEYTSYMGGSLCIEKPVLDLDDDCVVGLGDLAMFAASWLNCGLVPDCIE